MAAKRPADPAEPEAEASPADPVPVGEDAKIYKVLSILRHDGATYYPGGEPVRLIAGAADRLLELRVVALASD